MNPLSSDRVQAYANRVSGCRFDEPMSKHTTFRIGGNARMYVVAESSEALFHAVEIAVELDIPWYVFGGGSNLLVADAGYEGVVIQAANRAIQVNGSIVEAESGAITALVARRAAEAGLQGFAWAAGVPGTIGGAVYGDAGCYGGEMRDAIEWVDAYQVSTSSRIRLSADECKFGYRDSIFKHDRFVIAKCAIRLQPGGDPAHLLKDLSAVTSERKESQPLAQSSAGCVFKNVELSDDATIHRLTESADLPSGMAHARRAAAGWLIDRSGAKGMRAGDFQVSEKHGNFFVNLGTGKASDVVELIGSVKKRVKEKMGVELEEEVQFLGF